ncbi:pyridine nucleotide-disulfide oxidoreductase [Geovibrio thiophilus]|uniref:Pyridine nucleotide-disulfide oxidoreductase n=1 Tax=Geovibrio thiophilus TaxID=139438 RepID=A0A410K1Y6_9BACT|nr:FAD-dependent oxidoreductase [Geovibrio thiophilus]QAR34315.1 pyridine nucleotide-disulfide oxidoreductase [Geovibrio thiophilus]
MGRRIVVIGGVAAGATAAAKARRTDEGAEITVLEKGKYISYANCGLPYYTGGVIKPRKKILLHTPDTYGKRFNADVLVSTEATSINRKSRTVTVKDKNGEREIPYDKLIIAVGGKTIVPPVTGIDKTPYFTMRTVDDADAVRKFIEKNKPKTAVIIGGGFIGVETAEAMMHCGIKTTIVEAKPEIMPNMPRIVAMNLREYMEEKGISFRLGVFARRTEKTVKNKIDISLSDGTLLKADMLFLCAGVAPDTKLAADCGIEIGQTGGIAVDDTMRTSDSDIFAAGDVVEKLNRITGKKVLLPLAGPANREGRTAGFNAVTDGDMRFPGVVGTSIVGFDGYSAGQTGLTYEQAQQAGLDADYVYTEDADIAEYYPGATYIFMMTVFEKKTGRLLGCSASGIKGVDKRLDVASAALYAGLSVFDLEHLEFAYAPQFAKAKDNLNIAGFVASNKIRGTGYAVTPEEFAEVRRNQKIQILDVRTVKEHDDVCVEESVNIPVNALRENMDSLDKNTPVYVYCAVGFRGYLAVKMLRNSGFEAYNVSGGMETIARLQKIV